MTYEGTVHAYGRDVDTDVIIPARYLSTSDPAELARHCMEDIDPGFVTRVRPGDVIVAGENFGCGSSREHAPWALADFGFRAVIAPSYADIFFNNCYKNGLLPIVLTDAEVDRLFAATAAFPGFTLTVDLEAQAVRSADGSLAYAFDVEPFRKHCLINGLDDIGLTLQHADAIRAFEAKRLAEQPWLA
jgi:3-isopropylmalate/(R)-2-methylmalate dehydratase small subunit